MCFLKIRSRKENIVGTQMLETVDSFCCYLGVKFHYNGNLEPGIKALSVQP